MSLKLWQKEALEIVRDIYARDDRSFPGASDIMFVSIRSDGSIKDPELLRGPLRLDHFYKYHDDRTIKFLRDNGFVVIECEYDDDKWINFRLKLAEQNEEKLSAEDLDVDAVGYVATANWEILDKYKGDIESFFRDDGVAAGKVYPVEPETIEAEFEELSLFANTKLYFGSNYISSFSREKGLQFYVLASVMDIQKRLLGESPSIQKIRAYIIKKNKDLEIKFDVRSIDQLKTNLNRKLNDSINNPYRLTLEKDHLFFKRKVDLQ